MSLCIFFKPTEYTTQRVTPKVNYELWVVMMCQCRFIDCNKRTTLVEDVRMREAVHMPGQ